MIADVPTGSWIVWLGALVSVACGLPYARQAYRGAIHPSWVSWSVGTATTGYATATSLAAGAPLAAIVPGAAFVSTTPILVCVTVGGRRARARGAPRAVPPVPAARARRGTGRPAWTGVAAPPASSSRSCCHGPPERSVDSSR